MTMTAIPINCLHNPECCLSREEQLATFLDEFDSLPLHKAERFYQEQTPDDQEAIDFHCAMTARMYLAAAEQTAEDALAAQAERAA